jgi:hydroxymethylbilane synthase
LLAFRRDFQIIDIRGNLNTRFRKFDESGWEALVLAAAGIERLGRGQRIAEKISPEIILPAVGQGSFAVICRRDDAKILEMLKVVHHLPSAIAAGAERAMLRALGGGCQVPIGALAEVRQNQLRLTGCICRIDGSEVIRHTQAVPLSRKNAAEEAERLGIALAKQLLEKGGREILDTMVIRTSVS